MFESKTIVFMSAVPWEGLYARPQQLCTRLAERGAKVFFVEPPWTILSPLKRPELLRSWLVQERVRSLDPQLVIFTPRPVLPGHNAFRSVNRLNQRYLAHRVGTEMLRLGWTADFIWSHLPGTADWPRDIPIIYECVDEHSAFGGLMRHQVIHTMENDLLVRAKAVFATAESLLERCRLIRKDSRLVQNGADYEHFARASLRVEKKGQTTIGFYGGIGAWIDLELVYSAARRLKKMHFVMVGPVEPGTSVTDAPENVEFRGLQPYSELPSILAQFDVVMIPFKLSRLTRAVNPIKLYEYFAAGKPVIVTPLPELVRHEPLVYPVTTDIEFAEAVSQALTEGTQKLEARQSIARQASWEARLDEIEAYLGGEGFV